MILIIHIHALKKIKSSWLVWCTFIFHLHIELFIYHSFSIIILCFTFFCNIDPEIDLRRALDSVDRLNNKNTTPHVAYESLVYSLQSLIAIYNIAWWFEDCFWLFHHFIPQHKLAWSYHQATAIFYLGLISDRKILEYFDRSKIPENLPNN